MKVVEARPVAWSLALRARAVTLRVGTATTKDVVAVRVCTEGV